MMVKDKGFNEERSEMYERAISEYPLARAEDIMAMHKHLNPSEGEIILGYCLLYSLKRFLLEFLRGDNAKILAGLTLAQYISIFIIFSAGIFFIHKALKCRTNCSNLR